MGNFDFDFGFTAVDEDLDEVKSQSEVASENANKFFNDLVDLRDMIQPLLDNLKANPDKDYIHWPKRTSKVEAFEEKLNEICKPSKD